MNGYSLIEICIVVALIACTALVGSFAISWIDHALVRTQLDTIYHLFRALSRKAMLDGTIHTLFFEEKSLAYDDQTLDLYPKIIFGTPEHTKPITFVEKRVLFFPDGNIQAGSLYITDTAHRWYYALTCAVGHTCYIRRYRYHNNHWVLLV